MIIVEWASCAALDPHFKHVAQVLGRILAEPFTLRRLTDVPA
ncbi:hypothetical protein AB0B45_40430 [Nonomuraea sp. NPDC049152]